MMYDYSPPLFNGLSNLSKENILNSGQVFKHQVGEHLLQDHQVWDRVYWLKTGTIRMYYLDIEGREHNKRFFLNGCFFWPVTRSLREQETGFSMDVLHPAEGVYWPFDHFKNAFSSEVEWLRFSHFWIERLMAHKLSRERAFLQLSATDRYQALINDEPQLLSVVSDRHLASYLGMTPVSFSRIKKHFKLNK